jgi:phosphinothricin acetyltransferase
MQTASLLVRPSTLSDLGAVRDIHALAVTRCTGTFELEAPDAAEMARHHGVVRLLLAELAGRCQAAGARQMLAASGNSAQHGSIGPHRALGFERCGLLWTVGWTFSRWLDVVLMQRAPGAGAYRVAQDGAA